MWYDRCTRHSESAIEFLFFVLLVWCVCKKLNHWVIKIGCALKIERKKCIRNIWIFQHWMLHSNNCRVQGKKWFVQWRGYKSKEMFGNIKTITKCISMHVHQYMNNTYNGEFYQRNPFVCRFFNNNKPTKKMKPKNVQTVYTVAEGGSQLFWIRLLLTTYCSSP